MKVLVIIDNVVLYEKMVDVISRKSKPNIEFFFKHSSVKSKIWDHPDFLDKEDCIIDVNSDIEYIVSNFELIISAHCTQFFPKELIEKIRCINIHPGYNPLNRGWYPQVFAIINNAPIGATIHEMDEKLDNGPIISRSFVDIYKFDTSLSVYNRVLEKEIELFENNFDAIVDATYKTIIPESKQNFFTKKDFEELKEIDLDKVGSFNEFYDYLRALTHGDFKNSYFIDKDTGKRVYIKIEITNE